MKKTAPVKIIFSRYPDKAADYFDALKKAGARDACLFGGALRDTDCAEFQGRVIPVNDYDMRVWLPASCFAANVSSVTEKLREQGATVELAPNADNLDKPFYDPMKPRYEVSFLGGKMDLSFRAKPDAMFLGGDLSEQVAKDRAADSDLGLSAIAIAANNTVWASEQYLKDRGNLTLTVFDTDHADRSIAYAKRLQTKKYPLHAIVAP